jgi:hypothetical protein
VKPFLINPGDPIFDPTASLSLVMPACAGDDGVK